MLRCAAASDDTILNALSLKLSVLLRKLLSALLTELRVPLLSCENVRSKRLRLLFVAFVVAVETDDARELRSETSSTEYTPLLMRYASSSMELPNDDFIKTEKALSSRCAVLRTLLVAETIDGPPAVDRKSPTSDPCTSE